MKFYQLEYFQAVCRDKGFHNAARELGISQPSVTQAIKNLEKELNVSLFEQDSLRKDLVLTPAGQIVLKYTDTILEALRSMTEELQQIGGEGTINIRVAFDQAVPMPTQALCDLTSAFPSFHLDVKLRHNTKIIPNLKNQEFDFCITFSSLAEPALKSLPYKKVEFGVFFPNGHPFAQLTRIPVAKLNDQQVLFGNLGSVLETIVSDYANSHSISLKIKRSPLASDPQFFLPLLENSDTIAILPVDSAAEQYDVSMRKLDPTLIAETSIFYLKNEYEPGPFQAAMEFLRTH